MNSASFFCNRDCEYFPCHATNDPNSFNCLFCYCPLYTLGERCGGNFSYTMSGIKKCSDCLLPHGRDSASYIKSRFPDILTLTKTTDREIMCTPEPADSTAAHTGRKEQR